jgi:hypothetical protein
MGRMRRIRTAVSLAVATAALAAPPPASPPPAPFWPRALAVGSEPRVLTPPRFAPRAASARDGRVHHYEYVFPDEGMVVFDVDDHFRVVERVAVPDRRGYRGVAVCPATRRLYMSVGGNGGSSGTGAVIAYDLMRNRILWERAFPTGTDNLAVTPDGRELYVPIGEETSGDVWYVVDAASGRVTDEIHAGPGPHNTIVAPDGRRVYLGPRNSRFLDVASTRTHRLLRKIGPLRGGVRPFTINGAQTLAYTTATGFLGFQVSSIRTGRVLYTVPIRGFPRRRSLGTPSHGISLSPDSRELYVIDVPNSYVHVFDVSHVPTRPPRHVADIRLSRPMTGTETPCDGGCGRAGWLQHSLEGRYVYVGDSGDVIATRTRRVIAFLPALWNSRYMFELDWRSGVPVRTSTRSGIGYR